MTNRWQEIEASRRGVEQPEQAPPEVEVAMRALAENGDFRIFLNYYKAKLWMRTTERGAPNVSALLEIEGERNLLRDIEAHVARVLHVRTGRKPDPE